MKAICPKCNTAFEVKTLASLGGKARWQGVSVAERSKIAREAVSARWAKHNKHATDHATNPGQWMQSLHHESAHFIVNSLPACSNADNGAKIVPGMAWLPHDGCVRKCLRCMRHAENASHQAPAALDAATPQDASSRLPACDCSPSNLKPSNTINE